MGHHSTSGVAIAALLLTLSSGVARAQDKEQPPDAESGESSLVARVGSAFTKPLHPVVQTVASGGWLGGGVGYDHPFEGPWELEVKGVVTTRRYWLAEFDSGYSGPRLSARLYARARHMSRLNFFGPGPDSDVADWTTFTLRDPVIGLYGSMRVVPGVTVGGRAEAIWPKVGGGRHPLRPSIEQRFSEVQAPGLTRQTRFARYQGFAEFTAPAAAGWAVNQGGVYRISYDIFDDRRLNRFDFHRLQLEGRHKFAAFRPFHSVTVRGWISSATPPAGGEVPFFLQHTIGGTSNIRSMYDAPLGGEGTAGTLRAFANHRFRDNHLLLLQAEYRWPVWGPIDVGVYFDAGKAVGRRSALNLAHLKKDYGFSLNVVQAGATIGRLDFAFGGGEGTRIFVNFGGALP